MELACASAFAALISFLITGLIVPVIKKMAVKMGLVDVPDGKLKIHKKTTSYGGGLAVYTGFVVALWLFVPINKSIFILFISALLFLFVGLIDDIWRISPRAKFIGQLLIGLLVIFAGLRVHFFEEFVILDSLITLFWIVSVVNAFNLIDVMDGLATTTGLCATLMYMFFAWLSGQYLDVALLAGLAGALSAFLLYNLPTATIYLGDAGSLCIGGILAIFPLLGKWQSYNSVYGFLVPPLILAVPLLEIVALVIIRTYKGIPFYLGSPDHFCLYLKKRGWSQYSILIFAVGCCCLFFMGAYALVSSSFSLTLISFFIVSVLLFWCTIYR